MKSHFNYSFCLFLFLLVSLAPALAQEPADSSVFTTVEVAPEFPGGEEALYKFLTQNLVYPQDAKEKDIQGTVVLTFVIEKDGSISSTKVLRGVHPSIDEEAMRVVNKSPAWNPGYQRGKAVRVQFVLPIRFVLDHSKDDSKKKKKKRKRK